MKRLSQTVWFARWLQRLGSALLRGRKVIDLLPSFLVPRQRLLFDRRLGSVRRIELRRSLSDYWSYDQCIASTAFDLDRCAQGRQLRDRYANMLAEGRQPVILDCGANIGCSAYWFGVEFPQARILAVEPDPQNARLAESNTRRCANVRVIHGAVASIDCRMTLSNTAQGSDAFRTKVAVAGEIQGYSIESLLQLTGARPTDLLLAKIDIEGFEQELFSQNTEWVEHAGAIIVETHDWMLPGQATATNLLRCLARARRDFLVDGEHVLSFHI
jgi:FkbM family methyltransferase